MGKFNKEAVSAVDCDGKTALHLLFIDYKIRSKLNGAKFKEWRNNIPDIIHMICHQDPQLILKEDASDMNGRDLSWFRAPPSTAKLLNGGPVRRTSLVNI